MAKKLTPAKAKEILHDKSVHGHPLTDKQRKFFGAISNMKKGGWLDNYGEEANANDGHSSASKEWIGDGYSNVGRNYSPAWGGQFQTGGKLLGTDLNIFDNMMGGHNNSQYETYGDDVASNLDTFNPHYVRINDSNTNINYGKGLDFTNQPNYEESDRRYMPWYNNQAMPFFKTRLEDNPYYRLNTPNGNINYNTSSNYSNSEPSIIDEKNISPSWNIKQRNTRLEGRGGTYDDINTTTDNMNVVEQAKRKAEAFNKSIEKKYGDSSNPKAQERARILRNDIEVTPNYQLGGNVYPVNYVPQAQMGMSMPGATGNMYARIGAPSKGPRRNQTDVTDASAQNGQEMKYYQEGLDWKPKTISRNGGWLDSYEEGGVIKDDRGQWDHPGEITEINSPYITMQGVPYDVLGISDTGDTKLMKPGKDYKFKGKKVTEFPMAKNGLRQEQKGLVNLDDLTNFTNYNKPQPSGWLSKYE